MNDEENPRQRYIGQVHTALETHPNLVDNKTVVTGDFNWNVQWDDSLNGPLCGDFADIRETMNENGLCSAYHRACSEPFGEETDPTFYMHKNDNRPYHIDYAFVPRQKVETGIKTTVGEYGDWIDASDHMPLLIDF